MTYLANVNYKALDIKGFLNADVDFGELTQGQNEGAFFATFNAKHIGQLCPDDEVIIPCWDYPYNFRFKLTRDFLKKARTRSLLGMDASCTVLVEFEPY